MGVLEAWKDAEKVGYPVVGEEVKDASNVIDYNIRPEQTKDLFAEKNANNQTTTGMADVIPGINAPKIRAETSIVGGGAGGGAKIVEISDYLSVDEWQPVVDRVLNGEFVCVHCKFTDYSSLQTFYFTPFYYMVNQGLRFGAVYPGSHWFRINCRMTGTTVTSVSAAHGGWNDAN